MNLKEQATQYINTVGAEAVASALEVKSSTVKTWLKTQRFPVELIELMQSEPQSPVEPSPEEPAPEAVNKEDLILQSLVKISEAVGVLSQRQDALEASRRPPEGRPAQGPQVVTPKPEDTHHLEAVPQFQTIQTFPGQGPQPVPETVPDSMGMSMATLLKPKPTLENTVAQLLAAIAKK